jgi:hypothetical protein
VSSATPSRFSSCRTDWLRADVETPRSLAAAAKLRRRATARNEFRALSGVKATVKVSYGATQRAARRRSYADFSDAISIEKRYFTSDRSIRS